MAESRKVTVTTETFLRGILIVLAVYILFVLRDILMFVLVAVVIASFVESGVRFFRRFKIRRELAVPIVFAIVVAIILWVTFSFVPIIFNELSGVITLVAKYLPSQSAVDTTSIKGASQLVTNLSSHGSFTDILTNIKTIATSFSNGVTSVIGSTFGGVIDIILVLVMAFYLSIQERGIPTLLRLLTPSKNEEYVLDLWGRTQYKIGLWFQGQLLLALAMGAVTYLVLALLGVQYAFLIGVITGIAELIPFGVIFAAIPAIVFAAIDGGLLLAFKVLVYYVLAQQTENYVLSPLVAKRIVGIPPLIVLLSFLIGITLAGFWGAVVAIPVTIFILEYVGDIEKKKSVVKVADNSKPRAFKRASDIAI